MENRLEHGQIYLVLVMIKCNLQSRRRCTWCSWMEFVGDDLVEEAAVAETMSTRTSRKQWSPETMLSRTSTKQPSPEMMMSRTSKERSRGRCPENSRPPPCRVEGCGRSHGDTARRAAVARRTARPASFRRRLSTCDMWGRRWRCVVYFSRCSLPFIEIRKEAVQRATFQWNVLPSEARCTRWNQENREEHQDNAHVLAEDSGRSCSLPNGQQRVCMKFQFVTWQDMPKASDLEFSEPMHYFQQSPPIPMSGARARRNRDHTTVLFIY